MTIEENIIRIKDRIGGALARAGRKDSVEIVCVTKNRTVQEIITALNCGLSIIGENRIQEALSKYETISRMCRWHMLGHLQTNKVKPAVGIFDVIQSVDSIYLLNEINHYAVRENKVQEVFIEIKVSEEASKTGVPADSAESFFCDFAGRKNELKNIRVTGIMAMSPLLENPEEARPYFRKARNIFEKIRASRQDEFPDLRLLSMGMTGDYEQAVEEGANMVRIGRGVFE